MRSKLVFLSLVLVILSSFAVSYGASGSSSTDSQPSNTDQFAYDLDAAFTFSGGVPDASGPSIYFGSKAVQNVDGSINQFPDEQDSSDSLKKWYIANEGSNNWGQGSIESTVVQVDGAIIRSNRDGIPYLVTPPNPGAVEPEYKCGDAITDGDNDERSCPEDYGLPSGATDTSTQADTEYTLTRTFNDEIGEYGINEIGSVSGVGDSGDDTRDFISYDAGLTGSSAFKASEHNQDETDTITGKNVGDGTVTYEDENWQETPDYYLKDGGKEIWMKYVKLDGSTAISDSQNPVQTYDLTTGTFDDYTDSSTGSYSNTDCSASSGWSCNGNSHSVDCKGGVSQNTVQSHYLKQETITLNADNPTRYMTSEGANNGIQEDTSNTPSFTVDVTYNHDYGTTTVDADNCANPDATITTYTCNNVSWGGSCSTSGSKNYWSEDTGNPDGIGTGNYYNGVETHEWEYRYQTLTYDKAKIFDVNLAENPSGHPLDSDFALFRGTSFKTNDLANSVNYYSNSDRDRLSIKSTGGTGYYSWGISSGTEQFSNDPSVSQSTFSLDVTGGVDFYAKRDSHKSFDADGPYGESDGYIAIKHDIANKGTANEQKSSSRQIVGTSSLFLTQESSLSDSSGSISYSSFVDSSDFNTPACPGDSIKCVASVDVSMKNLNNWGSTAPNSGVKFDISQTYPTTSSMSVCKMYQKLDGTTDFSLGSSSNQQCSWEPDGSSSNSDYTDPGGPGGDPSLDCGSTPGERWHTMEGPEVNENTFTSSNEQTVEDDYQACVQHSQCVYKGTNVSEGYVADISSDNEPGYETGSDSPDWEVCLNIHQSGSYPDVSNGYHSQGAHEFGGQWYDLDDERVDYYLRPGNDDGSNGGENQYDGKGHRLISQASASERENPNHVSYYYRKNPNPEHPVWNPRGYTGSGSNKNYYYGFNIEDDCDQDLNGCDDSGVQTNFFYSFIWENQGVTVNDYNNVRSPPVS